jgi:branched-chain amino acid transport system substrate-binding protein
MHAETRILFLSFLAAAALFAAGCGGERAVRIGVLSDCRGPFAAVNEPSLAGAEFPLLERGARLRGVKPSDGITPTHIAGQKVELAIGCSESGVYDILVGEVRRLIELDHADAIVAGLGAQDSLVLRELARKYPDIPFVLASNSQRETTAFDAAANVYRFEADDAQQVAGLGTYAYRDLGWRQAAVVADDFSWGWAQAEAFTVEFCSLGGRVVDRLYVSPYDPETADVDRVPVASVDGVASFVTPFAATSAFVREIARRVGDPSRRLVLGPWITLDPAFRTGVGRAAAGVIASSAWLPSGATPRLREWEQKFDRFFPPDTGLSADDSVTHGYSNAVQALLEALQATNGDLSGGRLRLRQELARTSLRSPDRVHLDSNRQAIVDTQLTRLVFVPGKKATAVRWVRTIHDVDESLDGLLAPTPTSATPGPCRKARPPAWAR